MISIAHKHGHHTIAEGVEYEYRLKYLKECDCDKVQGYPISKPLDEEPALKFLTA
ncbi:MAG: EAL domain-containing protein [Clostridiales bacterium]|nr:EAL domain-containing protein [Clostridiales bacterium]